MATKRAKKNPPISQEEIDRLVQQEMEKWRAQHTPKITTNDSKTFISFDEWDDISDATAQRIIKLLDLMCVKHITVMGNKPDLHFGFGYIPAVTIEIDGNPQEVSTYVQKFIDNKYTIPWR